MSIVKAEDLFDLRYLHYMANGNEIEIDVSSYGTVSRHGNQAIDMDLYHRMDMGQNR